jgi:phosphohistidine phosphatase
MNLFIFRHGLAVEPGTAGYEDSARPLTTEGKSKLKSIATAMLKLELSFDFILSSPYTRARQTAEIVAERLKLSGQLELVRALEPQGNFNDLIKLINKSASRENVLLVGHEPYLSELISLLVFGENQSVVVMKKAGLAKLRTTTLKAGRCALLEWLMTPKQMVLIGG